MLDRSSKTPEHRVETLDAEMPHHAMQVVVKARVHPHRSSVTVFGLHALRSVFFVQQHGNSGSEMWTKTKRWLGLRD